MLVRIPALLSAEELSTLTRLLDGAPWTDGRLTAGWQSGRVKTNLQLPQDETVARQAGEMVLRALERNPLFVSATLPRHVYPPLFNRYEPGMSFGAHVDNAVRQIPGTHHRVRTDISATLFLSSPRHYDGGELAIEDTYGVHNVKLDAGDLVVYSGRSVHRVEPVTRGSRTAAFFWVQSLVSDDADRTVLFELDAAIRELTQRSAHEDSLVRLTACYHNLLRRWAHM